MSDLSFSRSSLAQQRAVQVMAWMWAAGEVGGRMSPEFHHCRQQMEAWMESAEGFFPGGGEAAQRCLGSWALVALGRHPAEHQQMDVVNADEHMSAWIEQLTPHLAQLHSMNEETFVERLYLWHDTLSAMEQLTQQVWPTPAFDDERAPRLSRMDDVVDVLGRSFSQGPVVVLDEIENMAHALAIEAVGGFWKVVSPRCGQQMMRRLHNEAHDQLYDQDGSVYLEGREMDRLARLIGDLSTSFSPKDHAFALPPAINMLPLMQHMKQRAQDFFCHAMCVDSMLPVGARRLSYVVTIANITQELHERMAEDSGMDGWRKSLISLPQDNIMGGFCAYLSGLKHHTLGAAIQPKMPSSRMVRG